MNMVTPFEQLDLSIVPGPMTLLEPAVSFDTHDVVQYTPEVVSQAILSFPGARLDNPSSQSWWDWKARCEMSDGFIEVDMSLFETEPPTWGGSDLRFTCGPQSIISFWTHVRSVCPAAWLHDAECRLYSPESFTKYYLSNSSP